MGSHPANLALRFLLEIAALLAAGAWGWKHGQGPMRYLLAIGIPLCLAAAWGTFAVVDDPSRSGSAPVVTPGTVRLAIEIGFFAFATYCLYDMGYIRVSFGFAITAVIHYALSRDRVTWLIGQ